MINIRLFSSRKSNATFSYFVLGIASLAAIATSVIEPEYIARVSVTNNVIYVGIPNDWKTNEFQPQIGKDRYKWSGDGGLTWNDLTSVPESVEAEFAILIQFPKQLCTQIATNVCYRILGAQNIEYSKDDGNTWSTAWEIPPDRRILMNRIRRVFTPIDIAIQTQNIEEGYILIAAMGNYGVLILDANGDWSSVDVAYNDPVSFEVRWTVDRVRAIKDEVKSAFAIAILFYSFSTLIVWISIKRRIKRSFPNIDSQVIIPQAKRILKRLLISILLFVIALFAESNGLLGGYLSDILFNGIFDHLFTLFIFVVLPTLLMLLIWEASKRKSARPKMLTKTNYLMLAITYGTAMFGWIPFRSWVDGSIRWYLDAAKISFGIIFIAMAIGFGVVAWVIRKNELVELETE